MSCFDGCHIGFEELKNDLDELDKEINKSINKIKRDLRKIRELL